MTVQAGIVLVISGLVVVGLGVLTMCCSTDCASATVSGAETPSSRRSGTAWT
jgi:hypothetical protein